MSTGIFDPFLNDTVNYEFPSVENDEDMIDSVDFWSGDELVIAQSKETLVNTTQPSIRASTKGEAATESVPLPGNHKHSVQQPPRRRSRTRNNRQPVRREATKNTVRDGALGLLLRMSMQDSFPPSSKSMNTFIKSNANAIPSKWVRNSLKRKIKIGVLRRQLVVQLKALNCCVTFKEKIEWKRKKICQILTSLQSARKDAGKSPQTAIEIDDSDEEQNQAVISNRALLKLPTSTAVSTVRTARSPKTVTLVDTYEKLESLISSPPFKALSAGEDIIAIDHRGDYENLYFIQVAASQGIYIFDCTKVEAPAIYELLKEMLLDNSKLKLFHGLHEAAQAFAKLGGLDGLPTKTLDTQLVMEAMTGQLQMTFCDMLRQLKIVHQTKNLEGRRFKNMDSYAQRPIPQDIVEHTTATVDLLLNVPTKLRETSLWGNAALASMIQASDARIRAAAQTGGARQIAFDKANSYTIMSRELLQVSRPQDMMEERPLIVSNDTDSLVNLLSPDLWAPLQGRTENLCEIVLDKGRRPIYWMQGNRVPLGADDRITSEDDIRGITCRVGRFGSDNRACLDRQLHRISAVRNLHQDIVGLTMRVGRYVIGNADMIVDLLFKDPSASILFLGEPGSGKTTIVREVTRLLAERSNVSIVDTSNEIAGDGDVVHHCVGHARRMMVPSVDQQSAVMIECVQNHNPEVIVIDEIGRPKEVEAARTCKNRGIRMVASAHGDFRKLLKNSKLRGLIGDINQVTLGDSEARKLAAETNGKFEKVKTQRVTLPTFDIVVELRRGEHHTWTVIENVKDCVDAILARTEYQVQRRTRNPLTGTVQLAFGHI